MLSKKIITATAIISFIGVFAAGCDKEEVAQAPERPVEETLREDIAQTRDTRTAEQFTRLDEFHAGRTIGESRSSIIERFGEPLSTSFKEVENIYDPETNNRLHELVYEGLRIEVLEVVHLKKELLKSVALEMDSKLAGEDLSVGSTRPSIIEWLGKPKSMGDDHIMYSDVSEYATTKFYFEGDALKRTEWSYWID